MTEHDLLTVKEAASIMRVKPDTLYNWIRTGVLREPLVVRIGKTIRISSAVLERAITEGGMIANEPERTAR
jgi:excisionase family DNA binding protein